MCRAGPADIGMQRQSAAQSRQLKTTKVAEVEIAKSTGCLKRINAQCCCGSSAGTTGFRTTRGQKLLLSRK
ncbi:hypothetical protein pipiens_016517 [Culex pipiens pipiens]|uniref:Uncharacterized protein n=1 Tax=Culex pipiens pipiens TaxID=38569 RepID=A0ABD1CLV4_CULPP